MSKSKTDIGNLYSVRKIKDLKDMLEQSANLFAAKNAFLVKNEDGNYKGITYSQVKKDVDALGTALLSLGLKDKFIAVLGENRYEWCITYLSTVNGTGVIVPIDKELPIEDIEYVLFKSNASAIVFSGKYTESIKKLSQNNSAIKYYINMDSDNDDEFSLSFKQLVEKGKKLISSGSRDFVNATIDNTKMSVLLFTSGTTGFAKGVILSHKNICSNIMSICSTVYVDSTDSSLSILPLHHTYECTIGFLCIIYSGGSIAFNEGLRHIGRNLKEVRPTLMISVPLLLENVYKKIWDQAGKKFGGKVSLRIAIWLGAFLKSFLKIDIRRKLFKAIHENLGGRLRLIITGAAAIDPRVSKGFRNMGIRVLQGYGLTECSPLATGNRDAAFKDNSAGLPIPGVQVRIDNPDEKGIGEIVVKGDNVTVGYFENEKATKNSMKDGWFYTGDLGRMDKSGYLYITGRIKNIIVTKNGKNIYPEELEASINRNPFVQESLVWGKLDESSGDTHVCAQILPNLEAIKEKLKLINITKEDISKVLGDVIKSVNKNLPLYKHIKNFSIRDNEFIKTTTKKIKRHLEQKPNENS
ncbi:MAG TPA: AMP-binding protein [Clostridiales bacterium]|nr:AMP-binding protein [Clostridiales bacterium]